MNINFGSPDINVTDDLMHDIKEILEKGWVSIGIHVGMLETHFQNRFHVKHAIACSSATTGLIIAVKAAGWKNKKIALPAFTWPSTLYALECNGNIPVFCDIDRDTWLINEQYIGVHNKTEKAILVDTFGNQCNCDSLMKKETIIDAAHGYGLPNLGKRGIAEVVSLSFTKILTATEGGIILTDDDQLAETACELRRLSGRMEEINALIALNSLVELDLNYRQEIIDKYTYGIEVDHSQQAYTETNQSVFSILFKDSATRNSVMMALSNHGVETKVYYDPLVSGLPNTEYVYSRILSLPVHKGVIPVQDDIINIINKAGRIGKTPGKSYMKEFASQ